MGVQPERLRKLTESLVNIYSPSGKEEEAIGFLHDYLRSAGIPCTLQDVEQDRKNLLVIPEGETPGICFNGHVDTVAASDYENYQIYEENGELFGLGTSDMKGGCAAMVEAFHAFWEENGTLPPAVLSLVVGEEETGDGTSALLEEHQFSWAIVGEPTNLIPCFQHYGYIEANMVTRGQRMHASMATQEVNAVHAMLSSLLRLTDYLGSEKPDIIFNIRDVFSTRSGFVVPDYCESWLDLHIPPHYPAGNIIYDVEEVIRTLFPQADVEDVLTFTTFRSGYSLPEKGPIAEMLQQVFKKCGLPWQTSRFPSDSDAIIFWENGVRPVILGPGTLEKAHREDESVPSGQLEQAAQIYSSILASL